MAGPFFVFEFVYKRMSNIEIFINEYIDAYTCGNYIILYNDHYANPTLKYNSHIICQTPVASTHYKCLHVHTSVNKNTLYTCGSGSMDTHTVSESCYKRCED